MPATPTSINVATSQATYPGDTLGTAFNLGSFGSSVTQGTLQSVVATGAEITNVSGLGLEYPGNTQDPGHRDIPLAYENSVGSTTGTTYPFYPVGQSIPVLTYSFPNVYGTDPVSGSPLLNQITAQQEQDTEAIFALLSKYVGVQFELVTSNSDIEIATGDLRALGQSINPDALNDGSGFTGTDSSKPNQELMVVNAFDNWTGAASAYGGLWMTDAMQGIESALNLVNDDASPPTTIQNNNTTAGGTFSSLPGVPAPEPVFPGDIDIANMQYTMPTNANDINMYQFTVAQAGTVNLETIAQRLAAPSLLDTELTVFDSNGNKIAQNDNYYGSDSALAAESAAGYLLRGRHQHRQFELQPARAGQRRRRHQSRRL